MPLDSIAFEFGSSKTQYIRCKIYIVIFIAMVGFESCRNNNIFKFCIDVCQILMCLAFTFSQLDTKGWGAACFRKACRIIDILIFEHPNRHDW